MPGVAATVNGGQISLKQLAEQCLVRNGKEVLEDEINREILKQALQRRGQTVTQAAIEAEVDRAAEAYGYVKDDGKPNREAWLKHITSEQEVSVDVYVRDVVWPTVALKALVTDEIQISEEDINKGFIANYGERVQVLAIVVGNRHTANEVWKMAKDNPDERFFGELAHEYSIEPVSRANFGQVPPIGRYGGQPLIEEEAFSLNPNNKLSGVLSVADKFIILWYLGRTEPVVKKLTDVRDELVKDIHEKKQRVAMARMFESLKSRAQIDNLLAGTTQSGQESEATAASHQAPVPSPAVTGNARAAAQPLGPAPPRSATRPTPRGRAR
jgi:hypothetical protein